VSEFLYGIHPAHPEPAWFVDRFGPVGEEYLDFPQSLVSLKQTLFFVSGNKAEQANVVSHRHFGTRRVVWQNCSISIPGPEGQIRCGRSRNKLALHHSDIPRNYQANHRQLRRQVLFFRLQLIGFVSKNRK